MGAFVGGESPFGANDMAGNVEEYVADAYAPYPGGTLVADHLVQIHGSYRIARGGSWIRIAHLLIVELPGGNDTDIVKAALERGDEFSFLTSDLEHYRRQPAVHACLEGARATIEVPSFELGEDTHMPAAARIGRRLGLRHLN